ARLAARAGGVAQRSPLAELVRPRNGRFVRARRSRGARSAASGDAARARPVPPARALIAVCRAAAPSGDSAPVPPHLVVRRGIGGSAMILDRLDPTDTEFAHGTGFELKPQGACKAEVCVPLPASARRSDGRVDVPAVAQAMGMALVA